MHVNLANVLVQNETQILTEWLDSLTASNVTRGTRLNRAEVERECRTVLRLLIEAVAAGPDGGTAAFERLHDVLSSLSRSRAMQGISPSETAMFVFGLRQPLFRLLQQAYAAHAEAFAEAAWQATLLLDRLGLFTMEVFQKSREEIIQRQQRELTELSTPVVKLWDGILALPLIGTLDSERTQVVMENLLQSIVEHSAEIAIIDITGVPTVDTLVAQHLLKTVAAARLMGADCLISGIRPQIAQTMVHLGVELNVVSKATLASAFAVALQRLGREVTAMRGTGSGRGLSRDFGLADD